MPDRSFKRLLGETSLERKCRFSFGLLILVLVSGSFFWYDQRTENLVRQRTIETARMLVNPTLLKVHYDSLGIRNFAPVLDGLSGDLKPPDDLPDHDARALGLDDSGAPNKKPRDEFECATLARFVQAGAMTHKGGSSPEKARVFADGSPTWAERITNGKKEFQYIQAVFFKPSCLMGCHGQEGARIDGHDQRAAVGGRHRNGDLAGAVVVNLPMEQTYKAINSNRATLITAAMITAILAMFGSHMIIRYIIIKPIQGLGVLAPLEGARP